MTMRVRARHLGVWPISSSQEQKEAARRPSRTLFWRATGGH